MPVRSLNSAVFKWPSREVVLAAAREWAKALKASDPTVQEIYCIGSCARGNYGVGSDIDLVIVIDDVELSRVDRARRYAADYLPVPADVMVYTQAEWERETNKNPSPFGSNAFRLVSLDL